MTGYTAYQNIISHGLTITNSSIQSIAVEIGTTIVGAIPTGLVLLTSTRCALSIISLYKKTLQSGSSEQSKDWLIPKLFVLIRQEL